MSIELMKRFSRFWFSNKSIKVDLNLSQWIRHGVFQTIHKVNFPYHLAITFRIGVGHKKFQGLICNIFAKQNFGKNKNKDDNIYKIDQKTNLTIKPFIRNQTHLILLCKVSFLPEVNILITIFSFEGNFIIPRHGFLLLYLN